MSIGRPKDLCQAVTEVCWPWHLSYRTEQTYLRVICDFALFRYPYDPFFDRHG